MKSIFLPGLLASVIPIGASQFVLVVKNPLANAGNIRDTCLISGLRRSPGGGHGYTLQYTCLENPMGRGGWRATVHEVTKNWMQLSNEHFDCLSLSHMWYPFPGRKEKAQLFWSRSSVLNRLNLKCSWSSECRDLEISGVYRFYKGWEFGSNLYLNGYWKKRDRKGTVYRVERKKRTKERRTWSLCSGERREEESLSRRAENDDKKWDEE